MFELKNELESKIKIGEINPYDAASILVNKLKAYKLQEGGMDTMEANIELGFKIWITQTR